MTHIGIDIETVDPDEDKPDECSFCGWETTELTEAPNPTYPGNGRQMGNTVGGWLCMVCYSTHASSVFHHPLDYPNQQAISSQISWGINYLASLIQPGPAPGSD